MSPPPSSPPADDLHPLLTVLPPTPHRTHTRTVILQNGFDIRLGSIEVTVPWVVEGTDYSFIRAYLGLCLFFIPCC